MARNEISPAPEQDARRQPRADSDDSASQIVHAWSQESGAWRDPDNTDTTVHNISARDYAHEGDRSAHSEHNAISNRAYEIAFEAISDGILIFSSAGRVTHMNAAARRLLGLEVSESDSWQWPLVTEGTRVELRDESGQWSVQMLSPLLPFLHLMAIQRSSAADIRISSPTHSKARIITVQGTANRAADGRVSGGVVVMREVTESTQRTREAKVQTGHRRVAIEVVADGVITDAIVVFDRSERIIQVNTNALALLDLVESSEQDSIAVSEYLHLSLLQGSRQGDRAEDDALVHRILHGEYCTFDQALTAVLHTHTGRDVSVYVAGAPMRDAGGEVIGGALALRERRAREGHRRAARLTQAAEHSMVEASHIATIPPGVADNTRQDEFFATAAHELRNATAALQGYANMLIERGVRHGMRSRLTKWQTEAIEALAHVSGQVSDLADDIMDVSRIHTGLLDLHCHAVDLVALTQRVVQRLQATTCRHHIAFSTTAATGMAYADVRRIEQVLVNLIGNAIKYSPDGGVIRVTMHEHRTRGTIMIAVCDHGIGIPQDQTDHVFQRFGRADNARRLGIDGTGLGLYLSRELIERHGGHIWFTSVEGRSTTFYLSLPLQADGQVEYEV